MTNIFLNKQPVKEDSVHVNKLWSQVGAEILILHHAQCQATVGMVGTWMGVHYTDIVGYSMLDCTNMQISGLLTLGQ